MIARVKLIVFFLMLISSVACKTKKKQKGGGPQPMTSVSFIGLYPSLSLPFQFSDSSFQKKPKDSSAIRNDVFAGFVPDSVFTGIYGKTKPKIYPVGRINVSKGETYLFTRTAGGGRNALYIFVFDPNRKYVTGLALKPDNDPATFQTLTMDRRLTITQTTTRRNKDGSSNEGREVYSFSRESGLFTLIMTDALEERPTEIINPIDTLGRKYKYAGDYTKDKMNIVSIRDGRRNNQVSFFIHFEKSKECIGELKGEATIRTANTAEYNKDGDPCKLKFTFSSSAVTVKELEGCGSYRPLNCSFDLSFAKKKVAKPKTTKPKRKK
jgi:hypothetical protein